MFLDNISTTRYSYSCRELRPASRSHPDHLRSLLAAALFVNLSTNSHPNCHGMNTYESM